MSWLNPIRITNRSEVVFEDSIPTRDYQRFRQRCIYKHHRELLYMEDDSYSIVDPASNSEQYNQYSQLVKDYWNWVQGKDPDSNPKNPNNPNVTFLRDDIIGGPLKHEVGIAHGPREGEDQPWRKNVTIYPDMKIFFPVYHCLSVNAHPYVEGGKCDTPDRRKKAVKFDLANNFDKWARINGRDIDLRNHYIETGEFNLNVPEGNQLNREAGFNLAPGKYEGFAAGTYVYLEKLNLGDYNIDFGGRATDFHSQSIYNVKVKDKP